MNKKKKKILDKQKAILDAALAILSEKGFHGTSTAEISKKAGVASGTLFHYFKTKEELINVLYYEVKKSIGYALNNDLESVTSIKSKLKHYFMRMIEWGLENPQKFIFLNYFDYSPYINAITQEEAYKYYNLFIETVEDAIKEEILKDVPLDFMISYMSNQTRVTTQFILNNPEMDVDMLKKISYEMSWDSIKG